VSSITAVLVASIVIVSVAVLSITPIITTVAASARFDELADCIEHVLL
jgi:hypothetical protein